LSGNMPWDYDEHQVCLAYFDTNAHQAKKEDISGLPEYLKKMLEHIHTVWAKMAEEFD